MELGQRTGPKPLAALLGIHSVPTLPRNPRLPRARELRKLGAESQGLCALSGEKNVTVPSALPVRPAKEKGMTALVIGMPVNEC